MIKTITLVQPLRDCRDKALAGGKAVNLGILLRADFNVPDGFCVTTDAYRYWAGTRSEEIPSDLIEEITRSYRAMGSPAVAVRSSATAEDMSEASMAGQYDTFLDIQDEESLLNRVRCCWASLDSPRTRAYLKEHGIELSQVAMAVVVQRLVPSEVAGVLFSANPQTGSKNEMLVEASWGLGESVVSGLVQPDVLRIDKGTGRVIHARIADKQIMIPPGIHGEVPVEESRRRIPCVKGGDVSALWKLGLQAANHFGGPQDIEWAIHEGNLFLLQSRPITTLEEAEAYEELLKGTRAELRELIGQGRGPWVVHNISETLPHPTPLTWSVIKRFMSGGGGFGAMYRQAGFEPSAAVTRDGFLALVAGKIYMDASMTPEMFFEGFPFKYDIEALRKNPDAAQNPPTIPSGSVGARVKMARKAGAASAVVHALAADYDKQLTEKLIPDLLAYVREEKRRDLKALSNDELIELWHAREKRVMDEFAPQSLLPSLISGAALAELKSFLEENFWDEDPDQLATLLSSGHEADKTVRANAQLYEVARDEKMAVEWLVEYGHRAPEEFDLSTPRWRERPDELLAMARRLKDGKNPADLHHTHLSKCNDKLEALKAQLGSDDRAELDEKVALARRYMPFREDGKFYLMMGYDLLRDLAMEIGRRLEIDQEVFLLTMEEMFDALNIGFAPTHLLAQRKIQRRAEKRIPLPYVIDQSNIEEIGSPPKIDREGAMQAFAISPGGASGPARIVKSPSEAGDLGERYILVCPSTDPSWTPLFTNAAGLILECGGTLSHGAVVAREMSIPAVVLRDACALLRDGDVITVDGRNGIVSRAVSAEEPAAKASESPSVLEYKSPETPVKEKELRADLNDTRIDRSLVPPPPGKQERQSAKIRNIFLLIWGVYLAATFLLPENILYQPSLSFLDIFLWPLVRAFGRPWAVAIISGALGALTMIGQKYLTDNTRLLVAKRRAAALRDEAFKLPKDCPRDKALLALAGPVQMRIFMASLVPMAVMLGPLIMIFFWFPPRVDLAAWSLPPGSPVTVQALVKNESKPDKGALSLYRDPVTIQLPNDLSVGGTTPKTQAPPPIRETLTAYRSKLAKPGDLSTYPEEIREAVEGYREQRSADLDAFLATEIPPRIFEWTVLTPNSAGRWPVTVSTGSEHQAINVVLGDAYPPAPAEISGDAGSRIVSLKVVYPDRDSRQKFFTPIGHWDWGWLGVYLLAYLPAMFGMRAILKIA